MAKKGASFAEKVSKSSRLSAAHCPVCGELRSYVKQVRSIKDEKRNSWKFSEKIVAVCKCNSNEMYS